MCHGQDVIDMKGCRLSFLCQTAVLATITGTANDQLSKRERYMAHSNRLFVGQRTQLEQRQEFRQIDKALGLISLAAGQFLACILTVKQILEAGLHRFWQTKMHHFDGKFDCLDHGWQLF